MVGKNKEIFRFLKLDFYKSETGVFKQVIAVAKY